MLVRSEALTSVVLATRKLMIVCERWAGWKRSRQRLPRTFARKDGIPLPQIVRGSHPWKAFGKYRQTFRWSLLDQGYKCGSFIGFA